MRRVASVGWLLLVGCNRIFGITATQPWDAQTDVVQTHVTLTWQLATTAPSGAPSPMLDYPPFAPGTAPQIRIATLDGKFMPADYYSDPDRPGWIPVPISYFEPGDAATIAPWRLEYTLPGGVPHEVQWAPDNKLGHLVVPRVGRLDRSPVPGGSGYKLMPGNYPGPYHNLSVITTGLWTTGTPVLNAAANTIDYDFFNAASLDGPKGSPDAAQGDRAFVVDYMNNPDNKNIQCNVAVGAASVGSVALTAGVHTPENVTWDTGRKPVMSELPDIDILGRLTTGLGKLNTMVSGLDSQLVFGSVPSTSFPGLIGSAKNFRLPVPVMQTLLQCPQGPQAMGPPNKDMIPATAQPTLLGDLPTAVHVQMVEGRMVMALGVTLYSGIETVIPASAGGSFRMSFPAAMPTQIKLTTPAGTLDLVDNTDQIPIGAPAGKLVLDFVQEPGVGLRADYYDVYLHRIAGGTLTPVRIYTVVAPEVVIDGSMLESGTDYVFEIRSFKGHVAAPHGDFAPIDYPYGSAVVLTRTFRTS